MRGKLVTVFGGSGFLGSYLIPKLLDLGAMVRLAVRNVDQALPLKVAGYVGQVEIVSVNPSDEKSVAKAIGDSDYVVNLIGIIFESGSNTFERAHVLVPKTIAKIAAKNNVQRLVHVSAIGADPKAASHYFTTKGKGEAQVFKAFPNATILRPGIMFGAEDNFFNKFANMTATSPFLPIISGGMTKMQPVYVADVAEAICRSLIDQKEGQNPHAGKIFELGGPSIYTFKQLMSYVLEQTQKKRLLASTPYPVAYVLGSFMQLFPSPSLTRDQVKMTKTDNIVSDGALTLKDLRVEPTAMETIVPGYLNRYRYRG